MERWGRATGECVEGFCFSFSLLSEGLGKS